MNKYIKKIPILRSIVRFFSPSTIPFDNSEEYWISRYDKGGNSGPGSYNELAQFKAKLLNDFVSKNNINFVIEFGSGDGNQLRFANYPNYLGFDVSSKAIELCREIFSDDHSKSFKLISDYSGEVAELVLSLDVIYHLVEDEIFEDYMQKLFQSSSRFVIIYSSNTNDQSGNTLSHVKHRKFTDWIEKNKPNWQLTTHIPNEIKFQGDANKGSFADFYIYEVIK